MGILDVLIGFSIMMGLLLSGLPVASVMVAMGVAGGMILYGPVLLTSMGPVLWGTSNEPVLTAIPLFILLGELLLRSGLADRMYATLALWLGRLPGGLLHTNIGCCALFAATSGSSVATAATVGTVALPTLMERKYRASRALGSLAAGGTLGILIPPSVNLLVYGSLASVSVGQLFIAGVIPGILLTLLFMAFIAAQDILSPGGAFQDADVPWSVKLNALKNLVPAATVFLIVMGSIYLGIATPTESAALAVIVALGFVWFEGKLSLAFLDICFRKTARTTGMILLIIVAAFTLNVTLALGGITGVMSAWVNGLGLSAVELLFTLMIFYLVLGMFMDVLSMQVLTIPIVVPIIVAAGIDPIWFGIFVVLMCEVGMITPPVGMNLYVVQGVRNDKGPFTDVIAGAVPYTGLMLLFTSALIFWPGIATWLPEALGR
ncbi:MULTISPECIES: TRAP transporter large permease [Marivita]|uniref:TRAP transporter large permease protein n=1 Tax=Marivita cryptomonadis TaxID=505252 RepID=A0A9Q2PC31_9RHOB|nr:MULTISPECIES: TRAP transporter large permease [Marivita]MCR9169325.1 TRAP transporter large permease [Paracoccaceae bacterium]MBM2322811.1 TRAP transporter large permease [Marivita cryptomonadis]MBM2332393.1 TRAP transporter large permease [Marivita cryptomonadis]MBM2341977.1 TRAP transporter large permease [Marivita cryptomonadis]MBM2346641.1 TRAP transporter large permease [Marivita cryptomonadis]